jgi:hypothetical protein
MPPLRATCALLACLSIATGCSDTDDDDGPLGGGLMDGGSMDAAVPTPDASIDGSIDSGPPRAGTSPLLSFFVTSDTSATGNLGGLAGADTRCQTLATVVGAGSKTWRAFLSVERDPAHGNMPVEARSRIGKGPWYNAKGVLLASDVTALFALSGDPALFINERGEPINGQWNSSMGADNQHDVLTGTESDGGVAIGKTCADWTSAASPNVAVVGHSDGLGPNKNATPPLNSWYSVHENGGCNDTVPRGGAGKLYCFASN